MKFTEALEIVQKDQTKVMFRQAWVDAQLFDMFVNTKQELYSEGSLLSEEVDDDDKGCDDWEIRDTPILDDLGNNINIL